MKFATSGTGALFAAAPYHDVADPLDRVLGYIDFRASLLTGPVEAFTCLAGTMVQETFAMSPAIRDACKAGMFDHARNLEADIGAATAQYGVTGVTARSLALTPKRFCKAHSFSRRPTPGRTWPPIASAT